MFNSSRKIFKHFFFFFSFLSFFTSAILFFLASSAFFSSFFCRFFSSAFFASSLSFKRFSSNSTCFLSTDVAWTIFVTGLCTGVGYAENLKLNINIPPKIIWRIIEKNNDLEVWNQSVRIYYYFSGGSVIMPTEGTPAFWSNVINWIICP